MMTSVDCIYQMNKAGLRTRVQNRCLLASVTDGQWNEALKNKSYWHLSKRDRQTDALE